jgi:hypothetical protein
MTLRLSDLRRGMGGPEPLVAVGKRVVNACGHRFFTLTGYVLFHSALPPLGKAC